MDAIFQKLIECRLILKNSLAGYNGNEAEFQNAFILCRENRTWVLCHCLGDARHIKLKEISGLQELLTKLGDIQPEILDEKTVEAIKRLIRNYLFINFLEAFNSEVISESVNKDTIQQRVNRLSLLTLQPHTINPNLSADESGELILLPGNYNLLLDLGRQFSFGIQGLSEGGDDFNKVAF